MLTGTPGWNVAAEDIAESAALQRQAVFNGCELHVWPSREMAVRDRFVAQTKAAAVPPADDFPRWVKSPPPLAPRQEAPRRRDLISANLGPDEQAKTLASQDIETLLSMRDVRMIAEMTPISVEKQWNSPSRLSTSTAACYGELIVDDISYKKLRVFQPSLTATFIFRRFDRGMYKPLIFRGKGSGALTGKPGTDSSIAHADLVSAFAASFRDFAANR